MEDQTGDLEVVISVKNDRVYARKGNDIYMTIPISYTKAVLRRRYRSSTCNRRKRKIQD